ncbi:hypothetical protein NIES932_01000 [Raphidiopsis curvata NIES-932]|nr:hypothetical protein NIES932_01000 [Raphidiopsis curvata NIES-932]
MAILKYSGAGSASPVLIFANSLPMRRAAANKKCPEPQAGSMTLILNRDNS